MDEHAETVFQAPSDFVEDKKVPLIDLDLSDSKELWLIQWPINQTPDFDGQLVSLKLDRDGHLGKFEGSSGKSYEMFSLKSQAPEPLVFLSSTTEAKIAGKISRSVSLIHYPEPSEFQKLKARKSSHSQRSSTVTSIMSGGRQMVSHHSSRVKNSQTTPSSRTKSFGSGSVEPSKTSKRRQAHEQSRSMNHSSENSGKGNSALTSSGSLGLSEERKSKKQKSKS